MRVSNDSTWKGWPNFFKFRGTNSVAISSSWILAIREYFSLSTFLLCKIKNKFRYTNKKSDKIGLCVAWFQKSVPFSKIQYGGQLRITTEQGPPLPYKGKVTRYLPSKNWFSSLNLFILLPALLENSVKIFLCTEANLCYDIMWKMWWHNLLAMIWRTMYLSYFYI